MKHLLFGSLMMFIAAGCANSRSPELGSWQFTLEGYCPEHYEFRADGTLLMSSPPELSKATYTLEPIAENDFYKLSFFVTEHNGKPNCQGEDSASEGLENAFYLRFEDEDKVMRLFESPDLNEPAGAYLTREN